MTMRILVVDDSEDWRDLTEAALMAAGYDHVATADSALTAYSQLGLSTEPKEEPAAVDLIVLDVVMPKIDGIEACAQIRSNARYADVPVIMVTALSDMDSLGNAFVAGATDYITKPFNRVELLARVRSALKLKAELDRRKARESELLSFARSTWGDRDATRWIDDRTGLLVGPAAEAYLAAASEYAGQGPVSVIALSIDRLDALAAARGEAIKSDVLSKVAQSLSQVCVPIGVVTAVYPDGVIVLVAPRLPSIAAKALAHTLRSTIASLAIANPEAIAADRVTASIGLVTAHRARTELVAEARHLIKDAIAAGGNRVVAVDLSTH
jgi:PleD family two-component response regulator